MRHDVTVAHGNLDSDPRTAGIQGSWANRRDLAKRSEILLQELGFDEHVLWALGSLGLRPKVGALTTSRLLLFSLLDDERPQALEAPYVLKAGKSKLLGQAVSVEGANGSQVELVLAARDFEELSRCPARSAGDADTSPDDAGEASGPHVPGKAAANGRWRWMRPVLTWQDAESMAADHMRHMNFTSVTTTPAGPDGGLDIISRTAAAQVKLHAASVGAPDVQRLRGAADGFQDRLFYALAYTPVAFSTAEAIGVALFQFTYSGDVAAINATARALLESKAPPSPGPERGAFGQLTRQGRLERALGWSQQIQAATEKPISNRKRKGARQIAEREQAMRLVVSGLALLQDVDNPLYKRLRQERTLKDAEKSFKQAASLLGVWLH
jgi:hypothetical protein